MKKIEKEFIKKELLSKYYEINNNTATIKLVYDSFSELINQNFGDENVELLNSRLFDDVTSAIEQLPLKYDIVVKVYINDFGNYTLEEATGIIKENILLKAYSIGIEEYRNTKRAIYLGLTGVGLLIASYFCSRMQWPSIIFDVVNISGTLFIWESISMVFIEKSETRKVLKRYVKKVKDVELIKKD